MAASLTVRYSKSGPVYGSALSYGLSVEVSNAVEMPGKIFVVLRTVPSATDPELQDSDVLDEFSHVATPADLSAVPEDSPDFEETGSFYRTNYWEFSFRNAADLEESLGLLRKDIAGLVKAVNADLRVQEYLEETYE